MTPQEIFLKATEIKSAEQRGRFLDESCSEDQALLEKVKALLDTWESESTLDNSGDAGVTVDRKVTPSADGQVGSTIGSYKLLQEIGEGGFGVVYMAEQFEPIRRKVALKIVKPGMDTKDVVARFEAERQALALMEHPNIAKVLDGGVTEFGRPYFVMELVKGVPITEFCDKNKLSTRERVELFLTVCRAIDHAHRKGIIHRDIKPSNVMVTLHDGKPVCKVIDFGVSKALTQQLTDKTLFTAYGQMVGTPTYMSPEQAEMSGLDIDTRSDVYSLGVVLFELLTGTTPLGKQEVRSATYDELQRLIKEEEAPRPSTRISTLGESATVNANNRSTDQRRLSQQLRGDIDWIVIKALDKDRNRRYDSAKAMAEDLERHVNQEPVLARPPSVTYKTRKFLRRNRLRVAMVTAMGVIAAVVLSSGFLIFEGREKQVELEEQANDLKQEKAALETQVKSVEEARRLLREEVPTLKAEFKNATLYQMLMGLEPLLVDDAEFKEAKELHVKTVNVESEQELSFEIEIQNWDRDGSPWVSVLFDSQNKTAVLPTTRHRLRISYDGQVITERTQLRLGSTLYVPNPVGEQPEGMVFVPFTGPRSFVTSVSIPEFYIDQYEVSNAEFKEFVDAGGYSNPEYWTDVLVDSDGEANEFSDAIAEFVDSTGSPGPAHWVNGNYPEGRGNFPVHSVSWFEASAYARFRGKELPTAVHWRWASHAADELVIPHSNFSGKGTDPRGKNRGIGYRPIFDTAGNVSEWTQNGFEDAAGKCCCGGSWDDRHYVYRHRIAMPPETRSNKIGFRCMQVVEEYPNQLLNDVKAKRYQVVEAGKVTDELFSAYQSMYAYDQNRDLGQEVISNDLHPELSEYREENIQINTAYNSEKLTIAMLFPREEKSVFHPILFIPGADSQRMPAYDSTSNGAGGRIVKELLKTGRVIITANYQGLFDRSEIPKDSGLARREWLIQVTKDVSRMIDFLETRDDIDLTKLTYFGSSMGAFTGVCPLAMDSRFKAGVLLVGGAVWWDVPNEINPTALAPFITTPILMINGEFDNVFPLETSARPLYELMGSEDKELKLYPSSHSIDINLFVPYMDNWLKERFGDS